MKISRYSLPSYRLVPITLATAIGLPLIILLWQVFPPLTLAQAQARWQTQAVNDYRLRVSVSAEPNYNAEYLITVQNSRIQHADCTGVLLMPTETCADAARSFFVPGLFANVERLSGGRRSNPALQVTVWFDWHYGFPRSIDRHDPNVFDGDIRIEVEDFEILHDERLR
jgi:hypothetical protein